LISHAANRSKRVVHASPLLGRQIAEHARLLTILAEHAD
jgi:hypothetical protein